MAYYKNTEKGIRAARPDMVRQEYDNQKKQQPVVNQAALQRVRQQTKFERIVQRACRVHCVTVADLRSDRRDAPTVLARQMVCYWARRLTELSLPQIGRLLGDRDHTTVMYAVSAYLKKRKAMGRNLRDFRGGRK